VRRARHAEDPIFIQTCRDVLLSQARRTGTTVQEDQQNEQTLLRLIQEICSAPLPTESLVSKRPFTGWSPAT